MTFSVVGKLLSPLSGSVEGSMGLYKLSSPPKTSSRFHRTATDKLSAQFRYLIADSHLGRIRLLDGYLAVT